MRPRRRLPALLLSMLALSPAARGDDPAPTGDLAALQGAWTAKVGENPALSVTVEFKAKRVSFKGTFNGQDFDFSGVVRLDEKASPKTLDWTSLASPAGDELAEIRSIYRLDGDTLTLCSGGPGQDRPVEFKAGEGTARTLTVFTRKKADAPKADDLARLQGRWKAMIGPNKDRPVTLEIKGNGIVARITGEDGGETVLRGEVALKETASLPTIDFTKFKNGQGEDVGDVLGLYKVDGDALTLCVGDPGSPRPAEFKAGEDGPPRLMAFSRSK